MFKNYITVALRSLSRNKVTTFINIAGLAMALACCLLITLFVVDELSYDRYHSHADRLYRVTREFISPDGTVSLHLGHVAPPFGPLLKNDFPEFEEVARTLKISVLVVREEGASERMAFNEDDVFFAEPEIFGIFDIEMTEGNGTHTLQKPYHALISEKSAKRYFGDQPALGKLLRVNNQGDLIIGGVFKDFPAESHWHPDFLVAFATLNDSTIYGRKSLETNWGNNAFITYVRVADPFDKAAIEAQFPAFLDRHMAGTGDVQPSQWTRLYLQKVTDIHLRSQLDSEIEANGNISNVYRMTIVAAFIVLIACFNFINLSTAQAARRAREVGLRKVAGAHRRQLIFQFLSESIVVAIFALILAAGLTATALPWLNAFTGKELTGELYSPVLWGNALLITLAIGILAGFYPAFVISGFKPATVLKGQTGSGKSRPGFRQVLVVAQFSIGIVLIVATMVIYQQLEYANRVNLGYNKDQIVTLKYYAETDKVYEAMYNELVRHASVADVTRSSRTPTARMLDYQGAAYVTKGDSLVESDMVIKNIVVDHAFFNTYEIPIVAGRNFSKSILSDDSVAFIVNESTVRMLGMTNEELLASDFRYGGVSGRVIGIVRDFHFESLHEPIAPTIFHIKGGYGTMSVRVAGNVRDALKGIEEVWTRLTPERPFEFNFLSERYANLYEAEQRQGELFMTFSALAVFIACLGLFGLATFTTMQRIKEIGIRKALGASSTSIVALLSRETMKLVLIANLIAWPVAWYFCEQWLSHFAYRIGNNFLLYLIASLVALAVAIVTVSAHTLKAAMTNPANTLRHE